MPRASDNESRASPPPPSPLEAGLYYGSPWSTVKDSEVELAGDGSFPDHPRTPGPQLPSSLRPLEKSSGKRGLAARGAWPVWKGRGLGGREGEGSQEAGSEKMGLGGPKFTEHVSHP